MKSQHSIRENYKAKVGILVFIDYAFNSIQNSEYLFAVYINFSKAFDTGNRSIMLRRLQHIGVRVRVFDYLKTYLNDHAQYVAVDGTFSTLELLIKYSSGIKFRFIIVLAVLE